MVFHIESYLIKQLFSSEWPFSAEGFFLPPILGGIFLYEKDKPIRGIGAIVKRHQKGMLRP